MHANGVCDDGFMVYNDDGETGGIACSGDCFVRENNLRHAIWHWMKR
jgi:hypothetical protein